MINESILPEDIMIFNLYIFNNRVSSYVRQKSIESQGEISKSTIIIGDSNIPLSEICRTTR